MRRVPLIGFIFFLQACTSSQNSVFRTFQYALKASSDVTVSDEQVLRTPYASAYLRVGDLPRAFVILGYLDAGEEKWISNDKAMVSLKNGRLIKTLGLSDNVVELTQQQHDPLADSAHLHEGEQWVRILRWTDENQPRSVELFSTFTRGNNEVLTLLGQRIICQVWIEHVRALTTAWDNIFWIELDTGRVRQSRQAIGPYSPFIEFTLLKPTL